MISEKAQVFYFVNTGVVKSGFTVLHIEKVIQVIYDCCNSFINSVFCVLTTINATFAHAYIECEVSI